MTDDSITEIPLEECWELLRAHVVGRLAFHLLDEVHIAPVNYAVDRDTLLFRTAEGSKLLGVVMNEDVAFEIDGEDGRTAWSVIVRGAARLLDEAAAHRADDLPLRPWTGSHKYNVVEVTPASISGRRFVLDPRARHLWMASGPDPGP